MAFIGLCKETDQFVVRIDVWYVLGSRRIDIFWQDICLLPVTPQVFGELPYDRGS